MDRATDSPRVPSPNPFNATVSFAVDVPAGGGSVRIAVYDLVGRRVRTVVPLLVGAGRHRVTWDGRNDMGGAVPPGIYLVRLDGTHGVRTRRVIRMN